LKEEIDEYTEGDLEKENFESWDKCCRRKSFFWSV